MDDYKDNDGTMIVDRFEMRRDLPNQVDPEIASAINLAGSSVAGGIGFTFSFNFILNLLFSTGMNQMLSSVKNI